MAMRLEELHAILQRIDYPATKEQILDLVRRRGTLGDAVARLQALEDVMYGSVDTVMEELRGRE